MALVETKQTQRKAADSISVRDKLAAMFSKIMAGTITREEGTMLINDLAKENYEDTLKELFFLIDNPPAGVFPKTILHTVALTRNKAFNKIMVASLEHKNAGVSILAASELGRLRTAEAKDVLREHLNSESYHVRQASAVAIIEGFGDDGVDILKKHILTHHEPFYRATSSQALLKAERKGIECLLTILNSGSPGAVSTAATSLGSAVPVLEKDDVPKIFEALMRAGDKKETPAIIELLKVVALLKGKARGYKGFVQAFTDYPVELVKTEAKNALRVMGGL
ncbi:MAG: HEAT repeat domain-containing protein [Deltaproteobacteria bacterium]|nr:HEAT repeat domain-containing protein [Deltaproteobacteria bacterium]